ncbi:hypothetical protein [Photobacterium damselae]|uniref:hypothetical protein n=1 Tax=Photobacterium damselae TaxID=38293 RepID=UPI0040696DE7
MLNTEYVKKVVDDLLVNQPKEIKSKGKMSIWLLRQNMKHKDLEDYLVSDIFSHKIYGDGGVLLKEVCVFIAVDNRDNSLLFSTLLTAKFGKKFHEELKRNRVKHNHSVMANAN